MIPIRLELKNFMSYGTQVTPLDFRGIHLACLSGDNGNGKSAILDAVTWVLWGEARASADELIRLGTEEMRVTFDFEMNGDMYRVIRGRSRKASGNVWEVYIAENPDPAALGHGEETAVLAINPADLQWRSVTGQGIRDTGKVIQRILRMDHKTFINSAYIQQGRADEFTKQTVSDRKKILADILDLSRYDLLEQKAKERRGEAELRVQELGREIEQSETELANEETYRSQLTEMKTQRGVLETRIAEVEEAFRRLQARKVELDATVQRINEMEQQAASWRAEISSLISQRAEQERRVTRSREILGDKDRILAGQKKLHSTRERIGILDRRLEELRAVDSERSALKQHILMEKHKLDLDRTSFAKEVSELESKIAAGAQIEKDITPMRERIAELDKLAVRKAETEKVNADESDRWGALRTQYDTLVKETRPELQEKLAMIAEPGAECPLCGTELGEEKHQSVVDDYTRRIAEIDARILQIKKDGADAKARRDAARTEIEEIDRHLSAGMEIRRQLAQAEQVLFQIEEYRKQLPEVTARLAEVARLLDAESFAVDARTKLKEMDVKAAALEYDPQEHGRLKEEIAGLEQFEALAVGLRHAEESLPADESSLLTTQHLISARESSVAECERAITQLQDASKELPSVVLELNTVGVSLGALRDEDRELTGRIATLEHSIARCDELRALVAGKRKELEKAKKDQSAYSELVVAFGKKGVQSLIIENAIPEIQDEANRLLARMTDNAMQVSIETVREKKTGGSAETLDIRISDDMGTRSYDLYSGGEAFRVNFALRIALSKLLARRAGARLQTLIIDEGFGTQDAQGREKLVGAIDSIKDDFEKILVITHIDELKDAFPARIEVTKDSQGSQITVN